MANNFIFQLNNQFSNCEIESKINSKMANQRKALSMEEIAQSTQIQLVLSIRSHITQESNKGSSSLTKRKPN